MFLGAKGRTTGRKTMNSYEEKQEARKQRYLDMADKARQESDNRYNQAKTMAAIIPFGQPILIGHHSEKRDRNYREKIHNNFGKAFEAMDKAKHYEDKAASVGTGGISGDDPEALTTLRAQLESLEHSQETMKAANAAIRRGKSEEAKIAVLMTLGFNEDNARKLLQPDFCGHIGFADYQLTNNSASIRRIRERIAALEKAGTRQDREEVTANYTYREDTEENRIMFFFDGKPGEAVRAILKKCGFKWSPRRTAWVRQWTANGIYAARDVKEQLAAVL
jgi:hypothetical protein